MKKVLVVIFSLTVFVINAQDTAIVTWELDQTTTISSVTSGGVSGLGQSVTDEYIIRDYAGMVESQRVYAAGSGIGYWPNETVENMDRYCELKLRPKMG